ncbi:hypothetical protein HDV04_003837 [Boothiomyces sp. JEL0838]|nr:hypothetical protein HDV04_003837 [Boothiomyces sp. JEL0838]
MSKTSTEVKKPMNSFFRYKAHVRERIVQQTGTNKNSVISRIAAQMWAEETPEVRAHFNKLTEEAFLEHRKLYPNFLWPSKSEKFKIAKQKAKAKQAALSLNTKTNITRQFAQPLTPKDENKLEFEFAAPMSARLNKQFDFESFKTGWTPARNDISFQAYINQSLLAANQ